MTITPPPRIPTLIALAALTSTLLLTDAQTGESKHEHSEFCFHDSIGIQLWSLRSISQDDPELALDLVKAYGIPLVEAAGNYGWSPDAFLAKLDERGLKMPSAHVQYNQMMEDPEAVVAEMKALGVKACFVPWIPHEELFDVAEMNRAVEHFNQWGKLFADAGIRFGYHPHGYEFGPGELEGETLLDSMMRKTNPEHVWFEMDVFWVVHGGADPVELLKQYPDRWIALHIKDIRKGAPTGLRTGGAPASDKVVVGQGSIDWPRVIGTAVAQGVELHFLEEESENPLLQIPLSLEYLRKLELQPE